jgi:transcriptional regulator NrdR family protein
MPETVIKRGGRKEPFVPEKIVAAAVKAGATADMARNIADNIAAIDKTEIRSDEIREIILHELKSAAPHIHEKWLAYESGPKRLYRHYKDGLYRR